MSYGKNCFIIDFYFQKISDAFNLRLKVAKQVVEVHQMDVVKIPILPPIMVKLKMGVGGE